MHAKSNPFSSRRAESFLLSDVLHADLALKTQLDAAELFLQGLLSLQIKEEEDEGKGREMSAKDTKKRKERVGHFNQHMPVERVIFNPR